MKFLASPLGWRKSINLSDLARIQILPITERWRNCNSYSLRSFLISLMLGNLSLKKLILRESIVIMSPFGCSQYIIYPLDYIKYLMNTIFVSLGSSFPCLWVDSHSRLNPMAVSDPRMTFYLVITYMGWQRHFAWHIVKYKCSHE